MSKKPDMAVYHVTERGEGETKRTFWEKIGVAWSHGDGNGLTFKLDYIPFNSGLGQMVIRAPKADDAGGGGE